VSLNDLRDDAVLSGQLDRLEDIVRGIRPLVILDERDALRELLETFMSDGGERAMAIAAFAVIQLAKIRDPYWSAS
jgi:hypothetical protein